MLQTPFEGGIVLARPGDFRLFLLNPAAAALWQLHTAGLEPAGMVVWLNQRFGLAEYAAQAQVYGLMEHWHQSGLLDPDPLLPAAPPPPDLPCPAPVPTPPPHGALCLAVAEVPFSLLIDDPALQSALRPAVHSLHQPPPDTVHHRLHLTGTAADWQLRQEATVAAAGHDLDTAVVMTLSALVELGCQTANRLLVVHGAGLALHDGRGLLLIAPGGSGKTTLAAALNAEGYRLINDDVVPVTPDGQLIALGTPLCLKPGSWPVLAPHRPDLAAAATYQRYGQPVRFLAPRGPRITTPLPPGLLLFPRYQPGSAPGIEPLTPTSVLQNLIAADAVIRNLTQAKLEAIVRWVQTAPAYALTYPDLDSGLALVHQVLAEG